MLYAIFKARVVVNYFIYISVASCIYKYHSVSVGINISHKLLKCSVSDVMEFVDDENVADGLE